ncbi:MAG: hypothetical protein DRQ62_10280 [Gammaproteobacteria bacterium]|nr:MAG: hypothetical protein DRQ62_10280 [Gammaproteobacteria bacterium]
MSLIIISNVNLKSDLENEFGVQIIRSSKFQNDYIFTLSDYTTFLQMKNITENVNNSFKLDSVNDYVLDLT